MSGGGPRWARRASALILAIALTELILRLGFGVWLRASRIGCGVRPELLGRLAFAYSHGRPSPDGGHDLGIVPDPMRGHRLAPGLRGRVISGAPVSSGSRGTRGAREYAVPKPPSVIRFVALGDSFTFGEGVPDDATWPAQLESALTGSEVANLGAPAYAHDQMYFALRDDGMPLQPDAVILGFYANDKWRDELTFFCSEKPRFSLGPDGWRVENVPVPLPWDVHDRYRRLPLLYALPRVLIEASTQPPIDDRTGDRRATEILRQMRQLIEAAGVRLLIVNLPDQPAAPPQTQGFFHEYCARTGAECVDPWPGFRAAAGTDDAEKLRARFQLRNDIHYSREGYAVVAEALRRHLVEHPVTPASTPGRAPAPPAPR